MNGALFAVMTRQGGVFTTSQAADAGIVLEELRRRCRRGEVIHLRRSVYTTRENLEGTTRVQRHAVDAAAALLTRHQLALSEPNLVTETAASLAVGHRSAALLWDLPAPAPVPLGEPQGGHDLPGALVVPPQLVVELVGPSRRRRDYDWGVRVRPAELPPTHIALQGPIRLTSIARTSIDIARQFSWEDAVAICDAALRLGVERAELSAVAEGFTQWPGSRQARRAVVFADGRAESVGESLARCVLAELGLPVPELQAEFYDARGFIARVDFYFRVHNTIVEFDGRLKYTDPDPDHGSVWREKRREDRLRDAGCEVVRITWDQLWHDRVGIHRRVLAAFARAGRLAG
jgi:hypothetical protein